MTEQERETGAAGAAAGDELTRGADRTADRDRLAADLHGEDPTSGGPNDQCGCYLTADRLIAFGWTRLDEERLARAIGNAFGSSTPRTEAEHRASAAAIAKAYREDTER